MKLALVTGPSFIAACRTCSKQAHAGTEPYESASTGEQVWPEEFYEEKESGTGWFYCGECAAKLVVEDPTRAVNQYFSDTAGKEIEPEHLPES